MGDHRNRRLARLATELGRDDAIALCTAGMALQFVVGKADEGEALIQRALALNPNLAWAWFFGGWIRVWHGEPEVAIERLGRALRLSPNDPHSFGMQSAMAAAHFIAGRYAEALSWAEVAVREKPNFLLPLYMMAASAALAGRQATAEKAIAQVRIIDPNLRLSTLGSYLPFQREEYLAKVVEGLRLAGLPE